MIGTQLTYEAPDTLKGVLDLIGRQGYQVLTADQSLVSTMKKGAASPQALVSLRKVPGLATIGNESGELHIGTSTSYASLLKHEAIGQYPILAQALATIQDPHLRHNCTLGGALHYGGHAHAAVLAALMALDAKAVVLSREDDARLPIQSFSQYGKRVPLPAGKLVTAVVVPIAQQTTGCYLEIEQLSGRQPAHGIAVTLRSSERGVEEARIILAGFTEQPVQLQPIETSLNGRPLNLSRIDEAVEMIDENTLPVTAGNGPKGYYYQLAKVLIRRSLTQLAG